MNKEDTRQNVLYTWKIYNNEDFYDKEKKSCNLY